MKKLKNHPKDSNKLAYEIVRLSTEDDEPKTDQIEPEDSRSEISKYLSSIGRKGGLKGGVERAKSLSAKRRKEIAQKAATTRWAKKNTNK
jgi:hypothetical protein